MLALTALLLACSADKADPTETADTAPAPAVRPTNTTCFAPDPPATAVAAEFVTAYPNLEFERGVQALQRPGDGSRWYVVEQDGEIWTWDAADTDVSDPELFLDIGDRVEDGPNEAGLLGMAFHPDFATNGEYFLSYTADGVDGDPLLSTVSRFVSPDSAVVGGEDSEEILLQIAQPYNNHNGGAILWGPDDRLYLSFGDGGSAGDPDETGQDTTVLLGKILRIDPESGDPYGIPADNPFADGVDGAPEVYAWGLRNVWRMSFDRETGDLWAGDVGQDEMEEVDLIELGGNYGWDDKEGTLCYEADEPCEGGGLIDPVIEYDHEVGKSVVGGYVYRGSAIPALTGVYLFTDFYTYDVWGLFWDADGEPVRETVARTGNVASGFAEDAEGEIYALDFRGKLRKLVPTAEAEPSDFPELLSETGCFDGAEPGSALIPYEVIAPFWSDGAEKERFFALPDDALIEVAEDGDLLFPPRSVLVKSFRFEGALTETRLFVHNEDGTWAGYTYQWNSERTDASLVQGGGAVALTGHTWELPTSAECLQCHGEAPGRSLGLELAQLDRGRQLARFEEMGLFTGALPEIAPLEDPAGDGGLDARARAWLHTNCSACHRPEGLGRGDLDLRATAEELGACDTVPSEGDLGVEDARVIAAGEPERSTLWLRIATLEASRMPPLGSAVVDEDGVALIREWIAAGGGCP